MVDHLHSIDLGKYHMAFVGDGKAALREGEGVIAPIALEAWEAGFFSMLFAAPDEGFHRQIDPHCYVLQDLRVYLFQGGAFLFQYGKGFLLLIERKGYTLMLMGLFALLKQVVVQPTTLFKGLVQLVNLLLGGVYPILKHFTHVRIIVQSRTVV